MPKFLLVYHGGSGTADGSSMDAWMKWFQSIQSAVVDGGAPVARAWTLSKDGTDEGVGSSTSVGGYSVLTADSMQQASELAQGCPHLASGGTIQLCELAPMG